MKQNMISTKLAMMPFIVKTVDRHTNLISVWQVPHRALLVEVPVLKVSATRLYQHLVGFHCSVC